MDWAQQATLRCTRGAADAEAEAGAEAGREGAAAASRPADEAPGAEARPDLVVTCLPCQHWCARTPFDRNACLWASWHVATHATAEEATAGSEEKALGTLSHSGSYYFGGDTGYCGSVFAQLGEQPGTHKATAWDTQGCSLGHTRLQPGTHKAAAWDTQG